MTATHQVPVSDHDDVKIFLAQLSGLERQTVTLCYFDGLTQAEIAVRLRRRRDEIAAAMRSGLQTIARAIGELDARSGPITVTNAASASVSAVRGYLAGVVGNPQP
jgi:DNA-directed RNA polymerase specialized sigma24 family protein